MPTVTFVEPDGSRRAIAAAVGITLMEAARQHNIRGVVAQCGGACACATCHVYIGAGWQEKLEPPEDMELGMLESAWEPRANSRLSCQVQLTSRLDGLEVAVPARQGGATG
jgi:2Fe-2S ferredoxin